MDVQEKRISSLHEQFPCREIQIQQLGSLLVTSSKYYVPPLIVIHGLEATGKTVIVKSLLETFEIDSTWVSCSECITFRHLLETIGYACQRSIAAAHHSSGNDDNDNGNSSGIAAAAAGSSTTGRIDNLNGLYVQLQALLRHSPSNNNHFLVLDDFDRHREASQTSFAAIARLGDIIPNLCVILILRYPKTRHLSSIEPPTLHFPAYSKEETVRILSLSPSPIAASLAEEADATEDEIKWLWTQCCAALWETLGKNVARNLQLLRECAEEIWTPLVQPVVDGEHGPSEFSRLFNRLKAEKLRGNEEGYLSNTVRMDRDKEKNKEKGKEKEKDKQAGGVSIIPSSSSSSLLLPKSVKQGLPYLSKYLLCGAYLASYIPPSQDLRIFAKGSEKKARRHRHVPAYKKGTQKRQLNRRHLGPRVFSLERLLAIFHALVPSGVSSSVDLDTQISSLRSLRLITKSSAAANMDGATKWKVNVGYGYVHAIGRSLDMDIDMYLED